MARRRSRFKPRTRTITRIVRKTSKRRSSGNRSRKGELGTFLAAALYGATRETISNFVAPLTARVPLGGIADEVVLGVGAMFLKRQVRNPQVKSFLEAAQNIEAARLGAAVASGQALQGMTKSASTGGALTANVI